MNYNCILQEFEVLSFNMAKENFFGRLRKSLSSPAKKAWRLTKSILSTALILACMSFVIFISCSLRITGKFGIIFSSIMCAILAIPLTLIWVPYISHNVHTQETAKDEKIREQKKEIDELQTQNEKYKAEQKSFKEKIHLLENLTFNIETYQDVFKMCFREYSQNATLKNREQFNESDYTNVIKKWLDSPSKNYDEILSVMDCCVQYQRGVDLQNIKIAKINDTTVVVTGIKPEYTTTPSFKYKDFFSEVRHVKLDKNSNIREVHIENDSEYRTILEQKKEQYKADFEDSFIKGKTVDDDAAEIIKRAQNFIRIILEPIYPNVEFDDSRIANDALPLLEYLKTETDFYKSKLSPELPPPDKE